MLMNCRISRVHVRKIVNYKGLEVKKIIGNPITMLRQIELSHIIELMFPIHLMLNKTAEIVKLPKVSIIRRMHHTV